MSAIVSEDDCDSPERPVNPEQWTAIIPAAGHGSRLGYSQPKILFPLLGRPIMDWVLDAVRPVCSRFVFVLSPAGRSQVEPAIRSSLGDMAQVVIQERPTGMGDAVLCAEPAVSTTHSLIVWGDQITLSRRTVLRCAALHQNRTGAILTLPTILKRTPYIHIARDPAGRIIRVFQAREQKIAEETGESDCGLFLFSTRVLFSRLRDARQRGIGIGALTKEFNLLQVLPEFEVSPTAVQTMRISDLSETLGVNTLEDARQAEEILRCRGAQ